jgi:hypothetical protein
MPVGLVDDACRTLYAGVRASLALVLSPRRATAGGFRRTNAGLEVLESRPRLDYQSDAQYQFVPATRV